MRLIRYRFNLGEISELVSAAAPVAVGNQGFLLDRPPPAHRRLQDQAAAPARVRFAPLAPIRRPVAERILDSQSNVGEILNSKREIDARQTRALGERFGVAPAVFI